MIIITRPSPYGEELTQLCQQANLPAKHLPLFSIEKGKDFDSLQSQLQLLASGDSVIIASPQVSHIISAQNPKITFPHHVHYFAIGQHSASLFQTVTQQRVQYPHNNENSEGMIAYLKDIALPVAEHRVVILCGDIGRTLIKNYLEDQGALVSNIHVYQRRLIHYPPTMLDDNICKSIVITSVEHLIQLEPYCNEQQKKYVNLIVSGERMVKEAKLRGWQRICLAQNANNQNLFKTITTLCHNAL